MFQLKLPSGLYNRFYSTLRFFEVLVNPYAPKFDQFLGNQFQYSSVGLWPILEFLYLNQEVYALFNLKMKLMLWTIVR